MHLTTRPESPADYAAIHSVITAAFGQPDEAVLVERLRDAPDFEPRLSLVAECAGHVAGHILFSPIAIEAIADSHADVGSRRLKPAAQNMIPALALAPVAVLPEYQRQGIGSALIRAGLDACRILGHRIVVVCGHPEYYPRFEFLRADHYHILPPFEVPPAAFMVCGLAAGAFDGVSGVVRYPKAFMDAC